jgi:hypothetical protein
MSQEQGSNDGRKQLEAVLDALNARDFQSLTELLDPAVEFRSVLGATEGEAAYTGIDGLRKWAEEADAIWEDWHRKWWTTARWARVRPSPSSARRGGRRRAGCPSTPVPETW